MLTLQRQLLKTLLNMLDAHGLGDHAFEQRQPSPSRHFAAGVPQITCVLGLPSRFLKDRE